MLELNVVTDRLSRTTPTHLSGHVQPPGGNLFLIVYRDILYSEGEILSLVKS